MVVVVLRRRLPVMATYFRMGVFHVMHQSAELFLMNMQIAEKLVEV